MENIIEMRGITKRFPGIVANDRVSLALRSGEIHAVLGENGAGKSTLMSILFGMLQPDEGQILINGKQVVIKNPNDANALGIGMVHQHFKLIKNFTVLENIILGAETVKNGFLDMANAGKKALELSQRYGLKIDPDALVSNITVGMQQRVEILKMLYRDNNILIFDEPTAVLTPQEITDLMSIMRGLADEGKSIILITHKLNEIKLVADRCTVLRHGRCIRTVEVAETSKEDMSEMMIGRRMELGISKAPPEIGPTALEVKNLVVHPRVKTGKLAVKDVSFCVRRGEITCIAGIENNGQSELIYAITGLLPVASGDILLGGESVKTTGVRQRNVKGIAHIPEDRQRYGMIARFSLQENLTLKNYFEPRFRRMGFIRRKEVRAYAERLIERFDIRCANGADTKVGDMSGGNQQKAVVGREISLDKDVLIAVQTTRGLDVGAARAIHESIIEQRNAGKAVLLVSLDLDEVLDISDRIIVMFEGGVVADLPSNETTPAELGLYMSGAKRGVGVK